MIEFIPLVALLLIYAAIRVLNLNMPGQPPILYYKDPDSPFIQAVLKACPILTNIYNPPFFWGRSGHLQTILHVKLGRVKPKWPSGERIRIKLPDGATMSYDFFCPDTPEKTGKYILAICPGIANSSECIYLRTFAALANSHGYRMAILNHIGSLQGEALTTPRVYTYGGTEEYGTMIDRLHSDFPDCHIVAVGFSMGGNIVTKYLGEKAENQAKVLCGMSVCQGYQVNEAMPLFLNWDHLRRVYTFFMTLKQRRILNRHRQYLYGDEAKQTYGELHENKVFSATALCDIDMYDTCVRHGFSNIDEYYSWCSSATHMHKIKIPMFYMNSEDDPVCPFQLTKYAKAQAEKGDNCIFMTTKHGGHLGYFEGGLFVPDNVTWLDRVIIEYADAVTSLHSHGNLDALTQQTASNNLSLPLEEGASIDNYNVDKRVFHLSNGMGQRKSSHNEEKEKLDAEKKEKRNSLKRGTILQQTTSYVQ